MVTLSQVNWVYCKMAQYMQNIIYDRSQKLQRLNTKNIIRYVSLVTILDPGNWSDMSKFEKPKSWYTYNFIYMYFIIDTFKNDHFILPQSNIFSHFPLLFFFRWEKQRVFLRSEKVVSLYTWCRISITQKQEYV